jgi:hypothetical protein
MVNFLLLTAAMAFLMALRRAYRQHGRVDLGILYFFLVATARRRTASWHISPDHRRATRRNTLRKCTDDCWLERRGLFRYRHILGNVLPVSSTPRPNNSTYVRRWASEKLW